MLNFGYVFAFQYWHWQFFSLRETTASREAQLQGEMTYVPPPIPISGHKAFFRGGGGGVYFEAHAAGNLYAPLFMHPPRLGGSFQGEGVYKIWPRINSKQDASDRTQKSIRNAAFAFSLPRFKSFSRLVALLAPQNPPTPKQLKTQKQVTQK